MHHANIGAHAADDDPLRVERRQPFRQVGVEKAAVTVLGDDIGAARRNPLRQFGDDFRLRRADDAMRRKDLELQVIGPVVVGNEQRGGAGGGFAAQQRLHGRNDAAGVVAAVQVMPRLQKAAHHINDQDCVRHRVSPPARASWRGSDNGRRAGLA